MPLNVPRGRILVVDDEPSICALLIEGLTPEGFECRSAAGGVEAIKLLEGERFDALISDLRMPGISGLALLETVRTKYPWMSVLIATGVDNVRVGVDAMKQGADDYILKPFRLEAVAVAVERALENKRVELELEAYRERLEDMVRERTDQLQSMIKSIQQTYYEIQETYDETLQALGAALALRDDETIAHGFRVTYYCLKIAKAVNCTDEQLSQISRGSYLHDIGKIGIPDAILRKPAKLTPEEVAIMRTHSRIGYEFVCHIPFLAPAAEIVLAHQESYDGSGYPQGLKGEAIPLGARIFAVADTLDAMTSDRPYRRALPWSVAFDEIRRESGRQFDPKVVEAFFTLPEEVWQDIRRQIDQGGTHRKLPVQAAMIPTTALPDASATPLELRADKWAENKTPGGASRASGILKSAKSIRDRLMAGGPLWFLGLCLLLSGLACASPLRAGDGPPQESSLPLLTRVEQIRNLSPDEANLGYPILVQAVVTYVNPAENDLFIQDSTAGVYVNIGTGKQELQPGQLVEVEGVSGTPDFAPQIDNPKIRVLGQGSLPEARRVAYGQMASSQEDSQWVEIEGIVRTVTKADSLLTLDLAAEGGRLTVEFPNFRGAVPNFLVDAKIRIQGVCGANFNHKYQITGVILYSPSLSQLRIVEPAPSNAFLAPHRPIASLLRFAPQGASGHRVRVRAVVTFQQPGSELFIKEENDGLQVRTLETTPLQTGDLVEVAGFPAVGEYSAVLRDAVFRHIGTGPALAPVSVTAEQALDGSHDADFVRITARLLDATPGPNTLNMESGKILFLAQVEDPVLAKSLEALVPGSLLQLTGICVLEADEDHSPQSFRILVRSMNDVAVIEPPPWWNIKRMLRIIAILAAVALATTLWAFLLKRQVAEKTDSIRDSLEREASSRERYQELFENANDMVFTCDLEGHLTSLNKAGRRMVGCDIPDVLRMNLAQILAPEHSALAREMLQSASEEGQRTYEVEIVTRKNGRLRVDLGTSLIERTGKPPEVQGIGRDITRHRRLEDQLRHAQKMEAAGRLAGGVAHDFNNLLTVISGFGQLVLGRLESTDPKYPHMAELLKAADRGATLTRQLLAFSRQQVLQPQVLDLNLTLANISRMLRHLIGEDVELSIVPGPGLGRVKTDPGEIDQVILNLAVNARDAMPHGGRLILQTENVNLDEARAAGHYPIRPGQYVLLTVSDTGCGMDAETQKHIFEPFFTTKEQGKGTGLGLATVHGIVHQSGGYIYVYSELGNGSCFKIYLPRVDQVAEPAKGRQALEHHARGTETILVVEDEAMVRDLTLEVLKESGYTVIAAERPDDALRICAQNQVPIDLLLTDVVMPGMSGLELVERLKPQRPKMKVLYVSGYTADAVARRGMSDPKTAFLQKPFAPGALVRKVRDVLEVMNDQQSNPAEAA
jgi:PAS domain S-box-containing protein